MFCPVYRLLGRRLELFGLGVTLFAVRHLQATHLPKPGVDMKMVRGRCRVMNRAMSDISENPA